MDEILASIRKIISDDEPEQETAQADAGLDVSMEVPEAADAPEGADEADDILDLTQVVQSQNEALPAAADPVQPPMPAEAAVTPAPAVAENAPSVETDIASILAEAGVEETVADSSASAAPSADFTPPQSAEEASITEALKAMSEPAGEAQAEAQADDAFMAETGQGDASLEAPAPAPSLPEESAQEDDARDALDDLVASLETDMNASQDVSMDSGGEQAIEMPPPEAHAEPEIAMPEPEVTAEEQFASESAAPEPIAPEPVASEAPAEPVMEEAPQPVVEPPAIATDSDADADEAFAAEDTGAQAAPTSFEQGIKDMIKPMLREWLDDNMERIVHDAVKEEVASGNK